MPVDSYMLFRPYGAKDGYLQSESQVTFAKSNDDIGKVFSDNPGKVFEVSTFSFDVEQTINMSSQAGGAGAGKIQFNPFKVTRKIDKATPTMYLMACKGTTFDLVHLGFRKAGGLAGDAGDQGTSGLFFLRFDFKLVALKTISWSHDDESPTEDLEFEYGGLRVTYGVQDPGGAIGKGIDFGWNKIFNVQDADAFDAPIKLKS